jgi:co-chaperonin GroES (HSP10)
MKHQIKLNRTRSSLNHVQRDWRQITPTKNNVLVTDMDFGERITRGGIIITDDDKKSTGIRPRWCRILAVGHLQEDVMPGQWILVAHGRWTRGVDYTDDEGNTINIRLVDPNDIMMVGDESPAADDTINTDTI